MLEHSYKGSVWKDHLYLNKEGEVYVYSKEHKKRLREKRAQEKREQSRQLVRGVTPSLKGFGGRAGIVSKTTTGAVGSGLSSVSKLAKASKKQAMPGTKSGSSAVKGALSSIGKLAVYTKNKVTTPNTKVVASAINKALSSVGSVALSTKKKAMPRTSPTAATSAVKGAFNRR